MTVLVRDSDLTIHVGDVRDVLPTLPAESVDCVATSPPFYGLRDYGVDGQIGLETTPDEWAAELVAVFRECRRILRPHGTLWVEVGDSYAQIDGTSYAGDTRELGQNGAFNVSPSLSATARSRKSAVPPGYKRKDLIGAPWLLAFALRADGWYLRQCIVWHKPNPMPESVRDRCTTAHSYVFLLSKQPRYFFDADAISEPAAWERWGDQTVPKYEGTPTGSGWIPARGKNELLAEHGGGIQDGARTRNGFNARWNEREANGTLSASKNARSVWAIPTRGYSGAHFATWPETLAERIILAGCPERVCGTCRKPRERLTEKTTVNPGNRSNNGRYDGSDPERRGFEQRLEIASRTIGWSDCGHDNYRPGIILDPFLGAGTTGLVARRLGRHCVGVELNEEYARMAAERCQQLSLLAEVSSVGP